MGTLMTGLVGHHAHIHVDLETKSGDGTSNNPEPLHGGADCTGATTETQPCKERSCPAIPHGYDCDVGQDKCAGTYTACDDGRCRCFQNYYFDGEQCISKTDICGESKQDYVIIIVGVIMGVVIVCLAAYAVYVTIQLRRRDPGPLGESSPRGEENLNKDFDSSSAVSMERSNARGDLGVSTEPHYVSLYSDPKDKADAYDVIVKN